MTQVRNYRLGPGNKLQEYIYLSKDGNSWHLAILNNLQIVLDPTSSIAVRSQDGVRIKIYYQGRRLVP